MKTFSEVKKPRILLNQNFRVSIHHSLGSVGAHEPTEDGSGGRLPTTYPPCSSPAPYNTQLAGRGEEGEGRGEGKDLASLVQLDSRARGASFSQDTPVGSRENAHLHWADL